MMSISILQLSIIGLAALPGAALMAPAAIGVALAAPVPYPTATVAFALSTVAGPAEEREN